MNSNIWIYPTMQCSPLSLSLVAPALPPPRKIEVITKNALVEIRRRCSPLARLRRPPRPPPPPMPPPPRISSHLTICSSGADTCLSAWIREYMAHFRSIRPEYVKWKQDIRWQFVTQESSFYADLLNNRPKFALEGIVGSLTLPRYNWFHLSSGWYTCFVFLSSKKSFQEVVLEEAQTPAFPREYMCGAAHFRSILPEYVKWKQDIKKQFVTQETSLICGFTK